MAVARIKRAAVPLAHLASSSQSPGREVAWRVRRASGNLTRVSSRAMRVLLTHIRRMQVALNRVSRVITGAMQDMCTRAVAVEVLARANHAKPGASKALLVGTVAVTAHQGNTLESRAKLCAQFASKDNMLRTGVP